MNGVGTNFSDEEHPPIDEPNEEELEANADAERRQHEDTRGHYYKGIWQGLVLGIFGNLFASFLIEFLKEWIPNGWWFITNTVGLVVVTVITVLIVWKMFVTAESYLQGEFYISQLKEKRKCLLSFVIIFVMIFLALYGLRKFNVMAHDVLPTSNITCELAFTEKISIDFFGGILPTVISGVFLFCLIVLKQIRLESYLQDFVILFLLSIPFSYPTLGALEVNYIWVSFIASLFAVYRICYNGLLVYVKESIKNGKLRVLAIKWKDGISSLLIAFIYASLAVLSLDLIYIVLIYLFSSNITMYIGGKGIVDAIVLAPLTTPFFVVVFMLLQILIKNLLRLFAKQRSNRGYRQA